MYKHQVHNYLELKLEEVKWKTKDLALKSGLNLSDISKLRGSSIEKLKA